MKPFSTRRPQGHLVLPETAKCINTHTMLIWYWIFCSSPGVSLRKQKRDPATSPLRHKVQDHSDPYLCRWRVQCAIKVLFRQNMWVWANKCLWSYSKLNTLLESLIWANCILHWLNCMASILSLSSLCFILEIIKWTLQ